MARATNPRSLDIIYFSSIEWNHTWQRPQQLAYRLSRRGKLIYVNPLGLRSVVLMDLGRFMRRIAFKFWDRKATALDQTLRIYAPLFYFPFPESHLASKINGRILRRSLQGLIKRLGIRTPIIWVGTPSTSVLEAIRGLDSKLLVYDCHDNFPFFHKNPYHIVEAEQWLASQAQVVFATAAELYDRMKLVNPRTYLIPNAADYDHFAHSGIRNTKPPHDIVQLRKPIVGYMGEIAQWFDLDLVYNVAIQHPDWNIVLIGPVHVTSAHRLFRLPNVHRLGHREYAELPAYVNQFDVCILPFKINALTSAVNPVKLYEYLAAGKPVVSTPLPEVLPFRSVVEIATHESFPRAIESALEQNDEAKVRERRQVAMQNTWDQRIDQILSAIREYCDPLVN